MATRLPSKKIGTDSGSLATNPEGEVGAGPMTPESLWPVSQQASPWAPLGSPWVCFGPRMLMLHFTEELG